MYVAHFVLCELSFLSGECVPLRIYQTLIVWDLCEFVPDAPGAVRSHAVPFSGAPGVWLCSQVGTGQPAASSLSWGTVIASCFISTWSFQQTPPKPMRSLGATNEPMNMPQRNIIPIN